MKIISQKPIQFILFFLEFNATVAAKNITPTATNQSLFTYLEQEQFTEVTLMVDLQELLNKKSSRSEEEQKAHITFINQNGRRLSLKTKVSLRGKYRRQFCDFPPLKLNFSKKQLSALGLKEKFDKYKLVTHCMDNEESDQTLLKEFAVYKMYNKVTPESFKVHLLKITYQDLNNTHEKVEQLAFLIEDKDELAKRLGGKITKAYNLSQEKFTSTSYYNTMVFNYMIGNLDWNVRYQKNLKFVKFGDHRPLVLVPYDFDLCGMVEPSYAILNPNFNQQRLDERFCIGKFDNEAAMQKTVSTFKNLKSDFIKCYTTLPYLEKQQTRKMNRYLASFYGFLRDESEMIEVFLAGKYEP